MVVIWFFKLPFVENIFKHIVNRDFELPLKDDMMLARYYSSELKGYNNVIIPKMYPNFSYEKKKYW